MQTPIALAAFALLAALPSCGNSAPASLISSLQGLADRGNAEAMYHLGMAHQVGLNVEIDRPKALEFFRRAAALGDPLASYKVGCYFDGQGEGLVADNQAEALKYKLVAANAGYALAQQDVASLYARLGNYTEALIWLERSAAQGWSGALMGLSSVYNGAPGIKPDPIKTAAYFQLFLERSNASEKQRQWLSNFRSKMSEEGRKRADEIARDFKSAPSTLSLKGLSGQLAAQSLADQTR